MTGSASDDAQAAVALAAAQLTFDLQFRQLQRSDTAAQSLILAVTLSAALATPLIISTADFVGFAAALLALTLIVYLLSAGAAVLLAMRVLYSPQGNRPPGESWLHYSHISAYTQAGYIDRLSNMSSNEMLLGILENTYVLARVVDSKAQAVGRAVRWTRWSFAMLGILLLARYLAPAVVTWISGRF